MKIKLNKEDKKRLAGRLRQAGSMPNKLAKRLAARIRAGMKK